MCVVYYYISTSILKIDMANVLHSLFLCCFLFLCGGGGGGVVVVVVMEWFGKFQFRFSVFPLIFHK